MYSGIIILKNEKIKFVIIPAIKKAPANTLIFMVERVCSNSTPTATMDVSARKTKLQRLNISLPLLLLMQEKPYAIRALMAIAITV